MHFTKLTAQTSKRQLGREEILLTPPGHLIWDKSHTACLFAFSLPESIRALASPLLHSFEEHIRISLFGDFSPHNINQEILQRSPLLSWNDERFYLPALYPCSLTPIQGVIFWTQVDLITAVSFLAERGALFEKPSEKLPRLSQTHTTTASLASFLPQSGNPLGLFSLLSLEYQPKPSCYLIREIEEEFSPFPGLNRFFQETTGDSLVRVFENYLALFPSQDEERIDQLFLQKDYASALSLVETLQQKTPRIYFTAAHSARALKNSKLAQNYFFEAARHGHPLALQEENREQAQLATPLREAHPELFDFIGRGERLRTLTTLRSIAKSYPGPGYALLSYCLREAHEPEEGRQACEQSLAVLHNQSDVLNNKWRFLLDLKRDHEAEATAWDHTHRYPQEQNAISNLIDSALLLGNEKTARLAADRYAIFSTNIALSSKQYFKVYEHLADWDFLAKRFFHYFTLLPNASVDMLAMYGEVLTESGEFELAHEMFERALALEPGNGKVILGYARSLARADQELEAECLLFTTLADTNRVDNFEERVFLFTLLAEIQRRTGRSELALQTLGTHGGENFLELSLRVGPLPALEYAENLLLLGRKKEAQILAQDLLKDWPNDPYVSEMIELTA